MAGGEGWLDSLLIKHAPGRNRGSENRGLRIFCQTELVFRSFETDSRDRESERVVDLLKGLSRDWKFFGKIFTHAHGLGTLSGKEKCGLGRIHILCTCDSVHLLISQICHPEPSRRRREREGPYVKFAHHQ